MTRIIEFLHNNQVKIVNYILPLSAMLIICRTFPVLSFFYYAVPFLLLLTFIFLSRRSSIYRAKTDYLSLNLNLNLHPASEGASAGRLNRYLNPASINTTAGELKHLALDKRLRTLLLLILAFGVWSALTAIWSAFPEVTLKRAGYFLLISIPPVILGYLWSKNRNNDLFGYLLPANILVVGVSLYSLITSSPANAWTGGHGLGFMGYAGHQNILAAAILFTIPSVLSPRASNLSRLPTPDSRLKSRFSLLTTHYSLLAINLTLLALTYSRASMLALATGVLVFLILIKAYKVLGVLAVSAVILIILFSTILTIYPGEAERSRINHSPKGVLRTITQLLSKDSGSILSRRMILWEPSFEAAKIGGAVGLGYGISAPEIKISELTGSYYENGRYVREKGNSVLALIEEVGIVGLLLFLSIIGYVLWILLKPFNIQHLTFKTQTNHPELDEGHSSNQNSHSELDEECHPELDEGHSFTHAHQFLLAVIAALCIHAQFEGWWVGVGSIQLPIFFMIIGQSLQIHPVSK